MKGIWIKDRKFELCLGILLFAVGAALVWDATDNRGKPLPFPLGAITPF